MGGNQGDGRKQNEQAQAPSSGNGADSALDAMIKRRVPAPGQGQQQHAPAEEVLKSDQGAMDGGSGPA